MKNFIKKLKRLGMIVSIPILVTISIYYFDKEIEIQKEKNNILSEELSFQKEKCSSTSYSSVWGNMDAQKNIYKSDIKKLNEEISIVREELFYVKNDNEKYKKILEKLEALLFKKEQILKKIKETSNEKINCNSKINKIFKTIANENHSLKDDLILCKEGLSRIRIKKKIPSINKSKDIKGCNRVLLKQNMILEEKLSKRLHCKKENKNKMKRVIQFYRFDIHNFVIRSAIKIKEYGINRVAIVDRSSNYLIELSAAGVKYNYIRKRLIDNFFHENKKTLDIIYPWEVRDHIKKIEQVNLDYGDFYLSIGMRLKVDAILIIANRRNKYVTLRLFHINSSETLVHESILLER